MKNNLTEMLPKDSYELIDFLPFQVEKDQGHYSDVEPYLRNHQKKKIFKRYTNFFLKLYCYCDLEVDDQKKEIENPKPKKLIKMIQNSVKNDGILQIRAKDTVFLITGSDLYITVYNPNPIRDLIKALADSEGLFLRKREL